MSSRRALLGRACLYLGVALAAGTAVPGVASAQPGGSGTVKTTVVGANGPANQPHAGCGFQARLYGFGAGQRGTITVSKVAPTGSGEVARQVALLSDDPSGGSSDVDQVFLFTAAGMGLSGPAPGAKGWHLRVAVRPDGARSAVTKQLWLACPQVARAAPRAAAVSRQVTKAQLRRPAARVQAAQAVQPRRVAAAARPPAAVRTVVVQGYYRLPENDTMGPWRPTSSPRDSGWLQVKLLISVLAATVITARLVAWAGGRGPTPWRAFP